MATDLADPTAALWIDVATRLREVREAERRFLDLWHFERAETNADAPGETAIDLPQTSRWQTAGEERSAD